MKIANGLESACAVPDPEGGEGLLAAAVPGSFILNLCALSAPLAIPQPRAPELKRFRFFVSRRVTNGRETFFLHMGFFPTLLESEKWLGVMRGTYPNAFVTQLSATPRISSSPAPALDDTQALRVLEVRRPARDPDRGETQHESGSYAVQSQARLSGSLSSAATAARPTHLPAPQAKPAHPTAPAAHAPGQRGASSLQDALQTLAASEFEVDRSHSSSTTGVRHLRVQIQKKVRHSPKPRSTRKP